MSCRPDPHGAFPGLRLSTSVGAWEAPRLPDTTGPTRTCGGLAMLFLLVVGASVVALALSATRPHDVANGSAADRVPTVSVGMAIEPVHVRAASVAAAPAPPSPPPPPPLPSPSRGHGHGHGHAHGRGRGHGRARPSSRARRIEILRRELEREMRESESGRPNAR